MIDYKKTFKEANLSYSKVAKIAGIKSKPPVYEWANYINPVPKHRWERIEKYLLEHNFEIYYR